MQIRVYPQPRNLWENSFKLIFEFSEEEKKEKDFWLQVWRVSKTRNLNYFLQNMIVLAQGYGTVSFHFQREKVERINKELIPFVESLRLWDEVERWMIVHEVITELKSKRYQEQPFYLRYLIWLRWMPYAYLRGIYWYISQLWSDGRGDLQGIHFLVSVSIGEIQATKMHWIYSGAECMLSLQKKKR